MSPHILSSTGTTPVFSFFRLERRTMKFHLYGCDPEDTENKYKRGFPYTCAGCTNYPIEYEITDLEGFKRGVKFQHLQHKTLSGKKDEASFLHADCVSLDLDNDHSDDPGSWIDVDQLKTAFPDVEIYLATSRHHGIIKPRKRNDKTWDESPRPRYHVYFPIGRVEDVVQYKTIKKAIYYRLGYTDNNGRFRSYFDDGAKGSVQGSYTHKDVQAIHIDGSMPVDLLLSREISDLEAGIDPHQPSGTQIKKEQLAAYHVSSSLPQMIDKLANQIIDRLCERDRVFNSAYNLGETGITSRQEDESALEQTMFLRISALTEDLSPEDEIAVTKLILKSSPAVAPERYKKLDRDDYIQKGLEKGKIQRLEWNPKYKANMLCTINDSGHIKNTVSNMDIILKSDHRLPKFRKNLVSGYIEFEAPEGKLPWERGANEGTIWTDDEMAGLITYMSREYGLDRVKAMLETATTDQARANSFDSLKEYFKGLPAWDGTPRVETLFIDYLGAEDSEYTRAVTELVFRACIARTFIPGIKFDCMPILIGDQGTGKSTLLAKIAPDDAFNDTLTVSMMGKQQGIEAIRKFMIVECQEMSGMSKAETESVKQFISTRDDYYREPYQRHAEAHPRRCVIIGTTNDKSGVLQDLTGNRRFYPIECARRVTESKEDLASCAHAWDITPEFRDQFWSELYQRWNAGGSKKPLCLAPELEKMARAKQEDHTALSEPLQDVLSYLDMPVPAKWATFSEDQKEEYWKSYCTNEEPIWRQEARTERIKVTCVEELLRIAMNVIDVRTDLNGSMGRKILPKLLLSHGWIQEKNKRAINGYGRRRVYTRQ